MGLISIRLLNIFFMSFFKVSQIFYQNLPDRLPEYYENVPLHPCYLGQNYKVVLD